MLSSDQEDEGSRSPHPIRDSLGTATKTRTSTPTSGTSTKTGLSSEDLRHRCNKPSKPLPPSEDEDEEQFPNPALKLQKLSPPDKKRRLSSSVRRDLELLFGSFSSSEDEELNESNAQWKESTPARPLSIVTKRIPLTTLPRTKLQDPRVIPFQSPFRNSSSKTSGSGSNGLTTPVITSGRSVHQTDSITVVELPGSSLLDPMHIAPRLDSTPTSSSTSAPKPIASTNQVKASQEPSTRVKRRDRKRSSDHRTERRSDSRRSSSTSTGSTRRHRRRSSTSTQRGESSMARLQLPTGPQIIRLRCHIRKATSAAALDKIKVQFVASSHSRIVWISEPATPASTSS